VTCMAVLPSSVLGATKGSHDRRHTPLQSAMSERTWQAFFDSQAATYEQNPFTSNTAVEVDFFLSLYPLAKGSRVLDVGCGTGRHSIELARRGYKVTGLDLSQGMLSVAREKATEAGVTVSWMHADATSCSVGETFDAAICLCEGAVGLIEKGENAESHDLAIFRNIAEALKRNAPFLLTALNGYSLIRQMNDEHVLEGRFDPATMIASYQDQWDLPGGPKLMQVYERLFIAPEMVRLLQEGGFVVDNVYGGTAGHWARRPLSLDEVEAMYVCRRR
jgi:2-polyprenyl-3-methyl-5-hydroxy-6-metoxy-1,4-benzoquinol methylase